MFLIANTFAICFNKDYLLTYLLIWYAIILDFDAVWHQKF